MMPRQKPGETIPTAKNLLVSGNATRKTLTLLFDTPGHPTGIEVPFAVLPLLLGQIATALATCPDKDGQAFAGSFAIREVAARLHGNVPTLAYEIEAGVQIQQTLDIAHARRLHEELRALLEHLDSLGASGVKH